MHLDIVNGQCLNSTIAQNLTYGYQGLPWGLNLGNGKKSAGSHLSSPRTLAFAITLGAVMWCLELGL